MNGVTFFLAVGTVVAVGLWAFAYWFARDDLGVTGSGVDDR